MQTLRNTIVKNLHQPLRKLGVLTKLQLVKYAMTLSEDANEATVKHYMEKMDRNTLFLSKYNAALQPQYDIDRKMSIAFWVFIHFAKDASNNYCASEYPGKIVFSTDKTYRITVCESKKRDRDMVALTQAKKIDGLTDIIVGVNLELEEIDENLLPETDFIYAQFKSKNILMTEPEIEFSMIKIGIENE